jgi:hypothetical protein
MSFHRWTISTINRVRRCLSSLYRRFGNLLYARRACEWLYRGAYGVHTVGVEAQLIEWLSLQLWL